MLYPAERDSLGYGTPPVVSEWLTEVADQQNLRLSNFSETTEASSPTNNDTEYYRLTSVNSDLENRDMSLDNEADVPGDGSSTEPGRQSLESNFDGFQPDDLVDVGLSRLLNNRTFRQRRMTGPRTRSSGPVRDLPNVQRRPIEFKTRKRV